MSWELSREKGFSLIELIVVIGILGVLAAMAFPILNPSRLRAVASDGSRKNDAALFSHAVKLYYETMGFLLPKPIGSPHPYSVSSRNATAGSFVASNSPQSWLNVDLSEFLPKLPRDPENGDTYYFSYGTNQSGYGYEVNVKFEQDTVSPQNDGGNQTSLFEVGTDLNTLYNQGESGTGSVQP